MTNTQSPRPNVVLSVQDVPGLAPLSAPRPSTPESQLADRIYGYGCANARTLTRKQIKVLQAAEALLTSLSRA